MREIRCKKCNRLLMKTDGGSSVIECKCPKCGYFNKISFTSLIEFGTLPGQKSFKEVIAQAQH